MPGSIVPLAMFICINLYFVSGAAWWRNKKLATQYRLFLARKHIPTLGLLKCYHLFAFTISCFCTNTITWEKDARSKEQGWNHLSATRELFT